MQTIANHKHGAPTTAKPGMGWLDALGVHEHRALPSQPSLSPATCHLSPATCHPLPIYAKVRSLTVGSRQPTAHHTGAAPQGRRTTGAPHHRGTAPQGRRTTGAPHHRGAACATPHAHCMRVDPPPPLPPPAPLHGRPLSLRRPTPAGLTSPHGMAALLLLARASASRRLTVGPSRVLCAAPHP